MPRSSRSDIGEVRAPAGWRALVSGDARQRGEGQSALVPVHLRSSSVGLSAARRTRMRESRSDGRARRQDHRRRRGARPPGRRGGSEAPFEGVARPGLTRDPAGRPARDLAALGAEVVAPDTADQASLERSFAGVHGVYSVRNHHSPGTRARSGRGRTWPTPRPVLVIAHPVYASAGTGVAEAGIGSWETKAEVAEHARGGCSADGALTHGPGGEPATT